MGVTIKSSEEIEKMRVAGRLAAQVLDMIEGEVKAGVTTDQLNSICHDFIVLPSSQWKIFVVNNWWGMPADSVRVHCIDQTANLSKGSNRLYKTEH